MNREKTKMTKSNIVEEISGRLNVSKKQTDQVVSLLIEIIIKNICQKQTLYFRGFGTFGSKVRKERKARNLKTNEIIQVPKHRVPYFKPGKDLKNIRKQQKH